MNLSSLDRNVVMVSGSAGTSAAVVAVDKDVTFAFVGSSLTNIILKMWVIPVALALTPAPPVSSIESSRARTEQVVSEVVSPHEEYLRGELATYSDVSGFEAAVLEQYRSLAWIEASLGRASPGYELTDKPSLVLTMFDPPNRQLTAEFEFDAKTGSFADEVVLVLTKDHSLAVKKVKATGLNEEITKYFT